MKAFCYEPETLELNLVTFAVGNVTAALSLASPDLGVFFSGLKVQGIRPELPQKATTLVYAKVSLHRLL